MFFFCGTKIMTAYLLSQIHILINFVVGRQPLVGNVLPAIPQTIQCSADQFLCPKPNDTMECVPADWVCDGIIDCVAAVDEPATCNNTGMSRIYSFKRLTEW